MPRYNGYDARAVLRLTLAPDHNRLADILQHLTGAPSPHREACTGTRAQTRPGAPLQAERPA